MKLYILLISIVLCSFVFVTAEECNSSLDLLNGTSPNSAVYKDCNFDYYLHEQELIKQKELLNQSILDQELRLDNEMNLFLICLGVLIILTIIILAGVYYNKNSGNESV